MSVTLGVSVASFVCLLQVGYCVYIKTPSAVCVRCFSLDYLPQSEQEARLIESSVLPAVQGMPGYHRECRTLQTGGANQTSPIAYCYSLFIPLFLMTDDGTTAMLATLRGAYRNHQELGQDELFISDRLQPYVNRLLVVCRAHGYRLRVRDDRVRLISCSGDLCNPDSRLTTTKHPEVVKKGFDGGFYIFPEVTQSPQ